MSGNSCRQGTHHDAHMFTNTTFAPAAPVSCTVRVNSFAVVGVTRTCSVGVEDVWVQPPIINASTVTLPRFKITRNKSIMFRLLRALTVSHAFLFSNDCLVHGVL